MLAASWETYADAAYAAAYELAVLRSMALMTSIPKDPAALPSPAAYNIARAAIAAARADNNRDVLSAEQHEAMTRPWQRALALRGRIAPEHEHLVSQLLEEDVLFESIPELLAAILARRTDS